ncbi:MAG: sulfatase [Bacteroidetes bacterium]|nr:sulfatase [Bacteroidota bacterium]
MLRFIFRISFLFLFVSANAQQQKPNIIWIVCEDISPFVSAYGETEIKTPNIDQLAKEGVRYNYVYTTAGVCAPSRSSIITGMYQTSIGTMHMRTIGDPKYQPVPSYSAVIPEYVKCFPEYLRKAGYYCTNNEKQDYQFIPPVTVWDENGPAASFRNRPKQKPFFSVFNLAITHESMLWLRKDSFLVDPEKLSVPPIYPNTITAKQAKARLFTNIELMDKQVGEIIQMLKHDGLYDNTIIFFYSDHGGSLPWMKREVLERGVHIPFVIRFPGKKNAGTVNNDLISSVDFAPSILSLAGIPIPAYMQGQAFLGAQKSKTPRKYVFAGRDRMDTEYDRVRMVRDGRYRYLYNYMPEKKYYQDIEFRLSIPLMKEILQYRDEKKLDAVQASWFKTKPVEELYDVEKDPYEIHNLVFDPLYADKLKELRSAFQEWNKLVGDMAATPEAQMIKKMWNGSDSVPLTATPTIEKVKGGVKILCDTKGASIGYRIVKKDGPISKETHVIQSWDFGILYGVSKNGNQVGVAPAWNVYGGETIPLTATDTLKVNAMRIGYKAAAFDYVNGEITK